MLKKIRCTVVNNKIRVSLDEITDVAVSVIKCPCKFLRVNQSSTMLFDDSMKLLWPDGVKRKNILLFVTDFTPYVTKLAEKLTTTLP